MTDRQPQILVVDDMGNWRALLRTILESEGYAVYTAARFSEAMTLLQERTFHVAVLDVRLIDADPANIDGLYLRGKINTHWGKTRTIVVTGYGALAREYGVSGFFEKSAFDSQNFREAVAMAVEAAEREASAQQS